MLRQLSSVTSRTPTLHATSNHVRQEGHVYSRTSSRATSTHELQYRTPHVKYANIRHVNSRTSARASSSHGEPLASCSCMQSFLHLFLLRSFYHFAEFYHFALFCHIAPLCHLATFRGVLRCDVFDALCKIWGVKIVMQSVTKWRGMRNFSTWS